MPSTAPRLRDLRAVLALTHECRDLGDDAAGWRAHWLAGLARLLDADCGLSGELEGLSAGRQFDRGAVVWGLGNGFDAAGFAAGMARLRDHPDHSVALPAYGAHPAAGTGLAINDLLAPDVWERSAEYQAAFRVLGAGGPLYCLAPIPGDAGVVTGEVFCRRAGRPAFTARQKAVLTEASALLRPLVGGPLARFAEPSPAALPPRVRQVLRCLLEGDADKQIAARLGISQHTVNQYTKVIFTHFGTAGRAELFARWVRRGWPAGGWADA